MANPAAAEKNGDTRWKALCRVGGVAALLAGVIVRRNLGAEVSLFSPVAPPGDVSGWFTLLENSKLLGLVYLGAFDIVDYALLGLMFLALYAALRRASRSAMTIATACGLVGIGVYFASNTALSMLYLGEQYAAATTEAQRSTLLAAGQGVLALNAPGALYHGSGAFTSFFLLAVAGLMVSVVMLRSRVFGRATAIVGIVAGMLDLAYCLTFPFVPEAVEALYVAAAGLMLLAWHVMVGVGLLKLARAPRPAVAVAT